MVAALQANNATSKRACENFDKQPSCKQCCRRKPHMAGDFHNKCTALTLFRR